MHTAPWTSRDEVGRLYTVEGVCSANFRLIKPRSRWLVKVDTKFEELLLCLAWSKLVCRIGRFKSISKAVWGRDKSTRTHTHTKIKWTTHVSHHFVLTWHTALESFMTTLIYLADSSLRWQQQTMVFQTKAIVRDEPKTTKSGDIWEFMSI